MRTQTNKEAFNMRANINAKDIAFQIQFMLQMRVGKSLTQAIGYPNAKSVVAKSNWPFYKSDSRIFFLFGLVSSRDYGYAV